MPERLRQTYFATWDELDDDDRSVVRERIAKGELPSGFRVTEYRYNVGASLAYMKNGVLREKMRGAAKSTVAFRHRYETWNLLVQPLALVRAWTLRRKVLR